MNTTQLCLAAAVALLLSDGIASAGPITGPVKPERPPPALRNAPAEKIAPPMNAGSHQPAETTGRGVPGNLEPHGAESNAHPGAQNSVNGSPQNNGAASGRMRRSPNQNNKDGRLR